MRIVSIVSGCVKSKFPWLRSVASTTLKTPRTRAQSQQKGYLSFELWFPSLGLITDWQSILQSSAGIHKCNAIALSASEKAVGALVPTEEMTPNSPRHKAGQFWIPWGYECHIIISRSPIHVILSTWPCKYRAAPRSHLGNRFFHKTRSTIPFSQIFV